MKGKYVVSIYVDRIPPRHLVLSGFKLGFGSRFLPTKLRARFFTGAVHSR